MRGSPRASSARYAAAIALRALPWVVPAATAVKGISASQGPSFNSSGNTRYC